MAKKETIGVILPEQVFRAYLLDYPYLQPIVKLLGIKGSFGNKTISQVCKSNNVHESMVKLLFDACLSSDFRSHETLPAYGLLQLCDLVRNLCDYITEHLQNWITTLTTGRMGYETLVIKTLNNLFDTIQSHRKDLVITLLPHIETIYELYYSPEYTSRKDDLWSFSVEFFPKHFIKDELVFEIENLLEQHASWQEVEAFHRLNSLILALDRIESRLILPVVLKMENDIITSFQKKKLKPSRLAYLSFPDTQHPPQLLSKREREVLTAVAMGLQNKEIAEKLGIALTTVISHRKHIVTKLGIASPAGLTVYAYTNGFLNELLDETVR
jgi:DNA-binding CsgD family transcriptional regulator